MSRLAQSISAPAACPAPAPAFALAHREDCNLNLHTSCTAKIAPLEF